ncbi:MAG: nucleotide exchange factor GrpE [Saprospiraceae bacterium]|nr:nucleotide exchange factor GrpE [Saprospiraceae bacterium]
MHKEDVNEMEQNEELDAIINQDDNTANEPAGKEDDLKAKIEELQDKNLRLFAEFENFRRRTQKEKYELIKTAAQDTLTALLPVLDDFDRAKKLLDEMPEKDAVMEGVLLVYDKLYNILGGKGLVALDSDNQVFDPELHDAISHFPVSDPSLVGKVIDTIEKGYLLNDKLIRHAKVVVGA